MQYQISIDQKAFTRKELLESFPKWEDLHYVNISDRSAADDFVDKALDKPLTAPNGFHTLGMDIRHLYGQENIDRQSQEILDRNMPAGLVTYISISEQDPRIKYENIPRALG